LLSTSVQVGVEGGDRASHRTIRGDESMSPSKRRSRRSRRAVFGRYIYAVGSNPESALLAGVPVTKVLVAVYAIGGLLTAVSGILFASRLNAGIPTAGTGYELNAIATCVIDGRASSARRAAPTGRRPALIVETLNNGGNLLDINSFYLQIITAAAAFHWVTLPRWRVNDGRRFVSNVRRLHQTRHGLCESRCEPAARRCSRRGSCSRRCSSPRRADRRRPGRPRRRSPSGAGGPRRDGAWRQR
jgi:hypothetical protein